MNRTAQRVSLLLTGVLALPSWITPALALGGSAAGANPSHGAALLARGGGGRQRIFEELLEWIRAHLHTPINLTQLEQRSGYHAAACNWCSGSASAAARFSGFTSRYGLAPSMLLREGRRQ